MKKLSNICMVIGLLFLTASCAGTMKTANADRLTEKNQVPFGNLEITPYIGNVVYAAQPDENTVKMFKDQNFDLVINIRELNEDIGFDEKKLVEDQGITYMQIPYMTEPNFNADFSNEALSKIKEAIDDATSNGKKVMLHCSHGQRAGSSHGMILYRDYGYTKEAALKASTAAGMNSEWAVPKFHKFIDNSLVKVTSFEGIDNIIKYKNFYIASQPSIEAINMMKAKGISTVITNRAQKENSGFEEQKAVEAAGLKFHRARIYNDRYGDINDGKLNVDELVKALDIIANTTDGDVLVHCGSGDRASMILAAHLFNMDENSPNEALSKARLAGLRHPGITEQLENYMGVKKNE
ncbi:MAG: hypothetical protein HOH19_03300 [Kordiimonadaceae bacterium]|jgi:protein tyrosine phosphatase (PTP) superfamily phosphohydrolase (DUF442 family)|nr:hypothetical protein [Kordiimonadaceae bacterium]MBT6031577.1 hypothetical protein [Kordiimonadaceae bacterium]